MVPRANLTALPTKPEADDHAGSLGTDRRERAEDGTRVCSDRQKPPPRRVKLAKAIFRSGAAAATLVLSTLLRNASCSSNARTRGRRLGRRPAASWRPADRCIPPRFRQSAAAGKTLPSWNELKSVDAIGVEYRVDAEAGPSRRLVANLVFANLRSRCDGPSAGRPVRIGASGVVALPIARRSWRSRRSVRGEGVVQHQRGGRAPRRRSGGAIPGDSTMKGIVRHRC